MIVGIRVKVLFCRDIIKWRFDSMKLRNFIIGLAVSAALMLPFSASAAKRVEVIMPEYPIVINGTRINNVHREYPFLWYDGITYFPMTYHDCAYLGVSNEWSSRNGNTIEAVDASGKYHDYFDERGFGGRDLSATIAEGKIYVNGERIRNQYEEYPILMFNDVLYFPMTWDWGSEFGWKIQFDSKKGLAVSNNGLTYDSEILVYDEQDMEMLEKELEYIYCAFKDAELSFYDSTSSAATGRAYKLVLGNIYPYMYDNTYDDLDDTVIKSDPRRKYRKNGSFKLPAQNVEWMIANIFNCEVDGEVYTDNSYYYKGYYYRELIPTETEIDEIEIRNLNIVDTLSDGKIKISADVCVYDDDKTTLWSISTITATVGLKEHAGQKYWSFYKVSKNSYSDDIEDAYIAAKGRWVRDIAAEYAATTAVEPETFISISNMWVEIEYKEGRKYYKAHTVLRLTDFYFSPSIWIYVDAETGECHHHW